MKVVVLGASGVDCTSLVKALLAKQDNDVKLVDLNPPKGNKVTLTQGEPCTRDAMS